MTAVKNIPESPVSESSYHFGKLEKNASERKYKLKTENLYEYLNLKFSCVNNNALIIKIENKELKKEKEEFGRIIYSLKIEKDNSPLILVIQRNTNNKDSEEFYTFQYKYSNESYNNNYTIANTGLKIEHKKDKNTQKINYDIALEPIQNYEKYNITYIVKGMVNSNNKYQNADLSLRFDEKQNSVEYLNPEINKDTNQLKFTLNETPEYINCIQVIAQIKDKENMEYLSYNLYHKEEESTNNKTKYLALFIIVGILLFVIIIALIVVIIIFNHKNKDLLDKVNQVSFQEDRDSKQESDNKDGLLYNNEENVLG